MQTLTQTLLRVKSVGSRQLRGAEPEYREAVGVFEAMRPLHLPLTIALAVAVSATALAAVGLAAATPIDSGERSADVARVAEQYRSRYQLKLGEARGLLAAVPATARGLDT